MCTHLPKSFRLVSCLLGVLFGGVLGIAAAQNALATAIPLMFGWLFLPLGILGALASSLSDSVTLVPTWLLWLTLWYYPLVTLLTGIYSYWMQFCLRQRSWHTFGLLVGVSIGVTLLTNSLAPSFNRNGTMLNPAILISSWMNLLVSVALGWGIACLLPRPKRRKEESNV